MEPSTVIFKPKDLSFLGHFCLFIARTFRLVHYVETVKDGDTIAECTNFTIINYVLKVAGPMHEESLTKFLLSTQVGVFYIMFVISHIISDKMYTCITYFVIFITFVLQ